MLRHWIMMTVVAGWLCHSAAAASSQDQEPRLEPLQVIATIPDLADICVAIGGGPGTLSEIALAMKSGTPVWCWRSWDLTPPPESDRSLPRIFKHEGDLLASLENELRKIPTS